MRALINIDYTYDFVAEDGKLTTGEPGQAIEASISQLTTEFIESDDYVVFAIDGHDEKDTYHPEMKLFPPHNIIGTLGRELYGELKDIFASNRDKENVYWMDKRHYSAFSGTDLDIRLRERQITELHLVGVCTDICVLHTAIDAYNLGYKIVIHQEAVASFNPTGHAWALEHFKGTLGAEII
ncbi:cysteine hydrolase family protein [Vagococcus xieshaowenii]|uniref:Cysteine hydrolase n=1 Tax=Vagococcus xieshaowenii TaxID=2562451 RepID=A0AAJ5EH17_9ENTE|nr:isochorismatase family cysteine hydrolase [Vagococcus xieshaowenii]QCA28910.1 cysteine hydrolase [Vagococcus xieshaowenii]TFZ43328.1 cysteine hydrolase [Vagococcus xieshaowenii]